MTNPLAALGIRTDDSAIAPPKSSGRTTLDQADFLALMTAQLKNQDPTKPVDNSEYITQLAQLSTVTGIAESNTGLKAIADKLDTLIAATTARTA